MPRGVGERTRHLRPHSGMQDRGGVHPRSGVRPMGPPLGCIPEFPSSSNVCGKAGGRGARRRLPRAASDP
eukprot:2090296-Pyramimonas_sp.AAC.1